MKRLNMKLKAVCEITAILTLVCIFLFGSYHQWQLSQITYLKGDLPGQTVAIAKFISDVDLHSPSTLLSKEQMYLDNPTQVKLTNLSYPIDDILAEDVTTAIEVSQDIEVLEPKLQHLSASFQSDKKVFIYHTHAREGWHGEEYMSDKNANSKEFNITKLGEMLGYELEQSGIGSVVSKIDYATEAPRYEWAYSYKYSRKSVKEILAAHEEIEMVFDLHRDSQTRKYTTATINGEDFAQIYFIIGKRNENWQQNQAFAERLHAKIEEYYPGLSRGIWGKNANSGNGEYNQGLHEQNVLIEIGGVENTMDENSRTIKALAHIIGLLLEEE